MVYGDILSIPPVGKQVAYINYTESGVSKWNTLFQAKNNGYTLINGASGMVETVTTTIMSQLPEGWSATLFQLSGKATINIGNGLEYADNIQSIWTGNSGGKTLELLAGDIVTFVKWPSLARLLIISETGPRTYKGTSAPSTSLGNDGDIYFQYI